MKNEKLKPKPVGEGEHVTSYTYVTQKVNTKLPMSKYKTKTLEVKIEKEE